jgi:hypothetical protein
VSRPAPEWERRAAGAVVASAPESASVCRPPVGCAAGGAAVLGVLLGAAAVLLLFRVELFVPAPARVEPAEPPRSSSTSLSSSSGSTTVTVGPEQSLLDARMPDEVLFPRASVGGDVGL